MWLSVPIDLSKNHFFPIFVATEASYQLFCAIDWLTVSSSSSYYCNVALYWFIFLVIFEFIMGPRSILFLFIDADKMEFLRGHFDWLASMKWGSLKILFFFFLAGVLGTCDNSHSNYLEAHKIPESMRSICTGWKGFCLNITKIKAKKCRKSYFISFSQHFDLLYCIQYFLQYTQCKIY